jgi:hypothetical protein
MAAANGFCTCHNGHQQDAPAGAADQAPPAPEPEGGWSRWARYVAVGGVAGAAVVAAAPLVLGLAGFTAGGVALGSVAAGWQATMGGVVIPLFSTLQSIGAAGVAGSSVLAGAGVGTAAGAVLGSAADRSRRAAAGAGDQPPPVDPAEDAPAREEGEAADICPLCGLPRPPVQQ